MLWNILSFIGGGIFGVVMMCCFFVAGEADKHIEYSDKADISEK